MTHLFISYAHQDAAFVATLAQQLQATRIIAWYDTAGLRGGQAFTRELEKQIDAADALIVVVSPASNASEWVEKEIAYSLRQGKRIIPFCLEGKPPLALANLQYVSTFEELLAALKDAPMPRKPAAPTRALPTHELAIEFVGEKNAADDKPIPFSVSVAGTRMKMSGAFIAPLDDRILADIRWYLEMYPQWPSGPDYDRAQRIEANLPRWGEQLFASLFDGKARDIYRQFERKSDVAHVLTFTASEPRVLQLPWEILAEEGGFLFTKSISIRRGLPISLDAKESLRFDLPIRVLMVVSRPDDKDVGFLDPRSSARALLDALDELGSAVEVEFLRPPTLEALDNALRDQTFHIVHFDGHGVYRRDVGLGFLLFERGDHSLDMVDAQRFGALLNARNIPLVILDACQTAMQGAREFSSVAAKLIEAGVGSVIAMNYSVLVPTTRKFLAAFYRALADAQTISAATEAARRALLADNRRLKIYRNGKEEIVTLQDWFLPALYQQASDPALFAVGATLAVAHDRARASRAPTSSRGGFPDAPPHGFKGRARELLELERLMLPKQDADGREKPAHRVVILHGWGGQGKTALATEAAHWFVHTGLFERAAFVSFERGGGLELALGEIGNALVSDDFAIHAGDPIAAIENALCEKSALIVWDNFESLLPDGNAPLEENALRDLLAAGLRFARAGNSRLLITTRDPEIPHADYAPSQTAARRELTGLAAFDALALAQSILENEGINAPPRQDLERLLDFLGGHPLSLHLVVPQLRDYTPQKLIDEFDRLLPNFSHGAGKTKDKSLRVSLEFSLNRLDAATRARLPQLAVFQGGAFEPMIWNVTDFTEEEWARVRPQLARAALIRVENLPGIEQPYIHFHPTLAPYLSLTPGPSLVRDGGGVGVGVRYPRAYHALATQLVQADQKTPIQARSIVLRELANLRRALVLMLDAGEMDAAVDFATRIAMFLDYFGRWRERDEVMARVGATLVVAQPGGKLTKAEYLLASRQGKTLLSQGRAAEAEQVFRSLLARMDAGAEYETGYERVITLQFLGRCLEAQGKPSAAVEAYRNAFAAAEKLEQTNDVKRTAAVAHQDLADVLTDLGRYDEARNEYEASLEIKRQLADERGVAVSLGQLGTLALAQGNLKEAHERYLAALTAFHNLGEEQSEAILWHQLGMVAQEAREWGEAERCYKESLKLKERFGDTAGAARTCNQLAIVAVSAGRPADAERWFRRAIELFEQLKMQRELATGANNLADLLLAQGRLDEAESLAQRAREIKETLDVSSEPWTTYSILARIADKRAVEDPAHSAGRAEDVRAWRRKEQASFAAFAGSAQQIAQWQPRIAAVVAAARGNVEAQQAVEQLCAQMEQTDWKNLAAAFRRILAGERDYEALAEGQNHIAALVVRNIINELRNE